jgi:hypothetical protein
MGWFASIDEPNCYEEAMKLKNKNEWKLAVKDEIKSLEANETEKPKNIIGCKWVFKIRSNPNESISRFKAELVARGF